MISRRDAIAALAGMLPAEINPVDDANPKDEELIDLLHEILAKLERQRLTSPPIGSVVAFAGEWPSDKDDGRTPFELNIGWLLCDGRKLKDVEEKLHEEMRKRKDANGKNLAPPEGGILARLRAVLPPKPTPDGKKQPADALPDYRGMFLRGVDDRRFLREGKKGELSGKDADGPRLLGSEQKCATKVPEKGFTTDEQGEHCHDMHLEMGASRNPNGKVNNTVTSDRDKAVERNTLPKGKHTHQIVGGDDETRPVNIAVYYIIKFQ